MRPQITLANLNADEVSRLLPYDGLVLLGYRGSIAHGMYVPNTEPNSIDDKDLMGVFIHPKEHYLGFGRPEVSETTLNEWDVVCYEFRKFVSLLLKSNPNVLSMLWLDQKYIVYENEIGKALRENRKLFVTKAAYHSFSGYAHGQLKRMTHQAYKGYMGQKRKQLVDKFGFDTKNGAHLIRLLNMGIEFLTEGELHVQREDASTLLAIKRGEWSLDKVLQEAEKLFALAKEAYVRSSLPNSPDQVGAEKFCIEMIERYLGYAT